MSSIGDTLRWLPDNEARGDKCLEWAQAERDRYFQGQAETINDILRSDSRQYRHLDRIGREEAGRFRWQASPLAKSIASDEEMYSRWAVMFYTAGQSATVALIQASRIFRPTPTPSPAAPPPEAPRVPRQTRRHPTSMPSVPRGTDRY